MKILLPGERLSATETVIASGWSVEVSHHGEHETQAYLVLRDKPAYYQVVVYKGGCRDRVLGTFRNIVPAVTEFNEYGGFY